MEPVRSPPPSSERLASYAIAEPCRRSHTPLPIAGSRPYGTPPNALDLAVEESHLRLSAEAHCLSFWARGSIAGRLACCEWLRRKSPGSEALGGNLDVSAGWGLGHSNAAEASGPSQHGPRTWRLAPWAPKITTRRSRSQACDSRSQWHHCRADLLVPARSS